MRLPLRTMGERNQIQFVANYFTEAAGFLADLPMYFAHGRHRPEGAPAPPPPLPAASGPSWVLLRRHLSCTPMYMAVTDEHGKKAWACRGCTNHGEPARVTQGHFVESRHLRFIGNPHRRGMPEWASSYAVPWGTLEVMMAYIGLPQPGGPGYNYFPLIGELVPRETDWAARPRMRLDLEATPQRNVEVVCNGAPYFQRGEGGWWCLLCHKDVDWPHLTCPEHLSKAKNPTEWGQAWYGAFALDPEAERIILRQADGQKGLQLAEAEAAPTVAQAQEKEELRGDQHTRDALHKNQLEEAPGDDSLEEEQAPGKRRKLPKRQGQGEVVPETLGGCRPRAPLECALPDNYMRQLQDYAESITRLHALEHFDEYGETFRPGGDWNSFKEYVSHQISGKAECSTAMKVMVGHPEAAAQKRGPDANKQGDASAGPNLTAICVTWDTRRWNIQPSRDEWWVLSITHPMKDSLYVAQASCNKAGKVRLQWKEAWGTWDKWKREMQSPDGVPAEHVRLDKYIDDMGPGKLKRAVRRLHQQAHPNILDPIPALFCLPELMTADLEQINDAELARSLKNCGYPDPEDIKVVRQGRRGDLTEEAARPAPIAPQMPQYEAGDGARDSVQSGRQVEAAGPAPEDHFVRQCHFWPYPDE